MIVNDPNSDFKSTSLFDVPYLRNGTREGRSYNAILIVTCTRPTHQCNSNDVDLQQIFNGTEGRAASLRLLSFLLCRMDLDV